MIKACIAILALVVLSGSSAEAAWKNGRSLNGLSRNGLAENGLGRNGIRVNGIRVNGLGRNGIRVNGIRVNGTQGSNLVHPDRGALGADTLVGVELPR